MFEATVRMRIAFHKQKRVQIDVNHFDEFGIRAG